MKTKAMVIVPYWVENVLKRNRLAFTEVLNYGKMRELMSVEDLSAFLYLQRADKIDLFKTAVNTYLLSSWEQTRSSDEKTELVSVVVPLSYSEDIISSTTKRLERNPYTEMTQDSKSYGIVDFEREAFSFVIKPGFVEDMRDNAKALDCCRDILKLFYGYHEPHEVSALPIFQNYLEHLRAAD